MYAGSGWLLRFHVLTTSKVIRTGTDLLYVVATSKVISGRAPTCFMSWQHLRSYQDGYRLALLHGNI